MPQMLCKSLTKINAHSMQRAENRICPSMSPVADNKDSVTAYKTFVVLWPLWWISFHIKALPFSQIATIMTSSPPLVPCLYCLTAILNIDFFKKSCKVSPHVSISSFKGKSTACYYEGFKEIKKFDMMALLPSETFCKKNPKTSFSRITKFLCFI